MVVALQVIMQIIWEVSDTCK